MINKLLTGALILIFSSLSHSEQPSANIRIDIKEQIRQNNLVLNEINEIQSELSSLKITRNISIAVAVTSGLVFAGGIKMGVFKPMKGGFNIGSSIAKGFQTLGRVVTSSAAVATGGSSFIAILNHSQIESLQEELEKKRAILEAIQLVLSGYEHN